MMPDELISYVESPDKLRNESLEKLAEVISKYPFFQTARILYVKNLHNLYGKIDKSDLNLTAAFVSDRKVLYYLINRWQEAPAHKEEIREEESDQITKSVEREVKDTLHENISDVLFRQKGFFDSEAGPKIELIPGMAIDIRKEYGEGIDLDNLSFSLNDLRIAGKKDELLEIVEEKPNTSEQEITLEVKEERLSENKTDQNKEPETKPEQAEAQENIVTESNARSFSEWLNEINGILPQATVELEKMQEEQKSDETVEKMTSGNVKLEAPYRLEEIPVKEEKSASYAEPDEFDPNSLIDKFIRENPRIVPNKEHIPASDISHESVLENDNLFTDTLARIYIKQGNYAKAILVYEKLSLKYPEKSAYFAGQISEINKLINK